MELDWSTFVLEIVNFLILVWILKRFLYKPIMAALARRRATVEKTLQDAEAKLADADAMRASYEHRLAEWAQEKRRAHEALRSELDKERHGLLTALQTSMKEHEEKARIVEERERDERRRNDERQALAHGMRFVSRLLERLSGPELEARLVDLALDELKTLSPQRLQALRNAYAQTPSVVDISSRYALSAAQRKSLERLLGELVAESQPKFAFHEDPSLIAGLRVTLGPWVMHANIEDELEFLTEHDGGAN